MKSKSIRSTRKPLAKLVLASRSPRRADILRNAGFAFQVCATDMDESRLRRESARAHVLRLARAKATVAAQRMQKRGHSATVIGADTVVLVGGKILGKPRNARDARRMLRLLSGRMHQVLTGISVLRVPGGKELHHVESTRVHFVKLSAKDIDDYIATGEPFDKAGAYGIQGIGGRFVDRIEGCYFNVMGLPLSCVWSMLEQLGVTDALKAWSGKHPHSPGRSKEHSTARVAGGERFDDD